jgi:hypothetical protein
MLANCSQIISQIPKTSQNTDMVKLFFIVESFGTTYQVILMKESDFNEPSLRTLSIENTSIR